MSTPADNRFYREPTHTPGPWRVTGRMLRTVVADAPTGHDDEDSMKAYGGHLVCESIQLDANARLIAASPEMLAALQMIEGAEQLEPVLSESGRAQVRAAIAKATGTEP